MTRAMGRVAVASLVAMTAACTTVPGNQLEAQRDPWEKTNRAIYGFNRGLDKAVISPATRVYRAVVLKPARRGITNAFDNATQPLSFINALLQGKIAQAFRTVDRFLINTTLGVGGLADQATDLGRPDEPEDFGQTFAVWGFNSGPYVMLPFFGPSTVRDAFGRVGEQFADPYEVVLADEVHGLDYYGIRALSAIDTRSYLMDTADGVLNASADEYATVRSAYLQLRQNEIYDGSPPDEDEDAPLIAPAAPAGPATAANPEPAPAPAPDAPKP